MENSVKQYIITRVFTFCNDLQVKENIAKNGFSVAMSDVIPPSIFEYLSCEKSYLSKHHVAWYVSLDDFGYDYEVPTICFYDDVDEE